ncbi:MAG: rhodanese-like domain-containing protein [Sulfuritalea sp.]|nr:rhodanese-like domain-containing protein [Sulfuritalea sp.]
MNAFKHTLLLAAGIGLITATNIVLAQETPAAAPAGVKLIDAPAVQALQGKGAVLIDTRKASEFSDGTIKGAISVPYDPEKSAKDAKFDSSQDKFDMAKIADKNKDYVLFCNSGTCWKSYKAAVVMAKSGYKNVHWYRSGFPDWKSRKLPTE